MLVRGIRSARHPWLAPSRYNTRYWKSQRPHSSNATHSIQSKNAPQEYLSALTTDLDRLAPRIDISADQIEIIEGPNEFYSTLKSKILGAKNRIYLSTLYIGKSEYDLIETLRQSLQQHGPELKISILTDALRGTREAPQPSCASLLASLVEEFPNQVEVYMYHTPNLTGLRKAVIPKRINEGWGLQHVKLYGFDDEIILSGANLSNDYFTNRQDRYHVFHSGRVTDYFASIHIALCRLSFRLRPSKEISGFELEWPPSSPAPNPLEHPKRYIEAATSLLKPLVEPQTTPPAKASTFLYPILSHPPTINTELPALTTLLARPIKSYTFTAGYFNPHSTIASSLLSISSPPTPASGTILTASLYANGFFGSKGISGLLPAAYSHLSLSFLRTARGKNIQLREWQRGMVGEKDGWTYHAKGLWVTLPTSDGAKAAGPSASVIGSSNYTTRSYGLDLEAGAIVVTSDEDLMRKWRGEEKMLADSSREVGEEELMGKDRRANWRTRVAMWLVKVLGGAL